MSDPKPLTLSVIVPVFNEERLLPACLAALERELAPGDEIIVVDNNSTDRSAEIAKGYSLVKLIEEPRQGLSFSRNRGFSFASGDILGRIDADTQVLSGWAARVRAAFADPEVAGVTGPARVRDFSQRWLPMLFWSRWYLKQTARLFGHPVLWGANMAIRRSAWEAVRDRVTSDDSLVHEDQDLSAVLHDAGFKLKVDDRMQVSIHGIWYFYPPKFIDYVRRRYNTAKLHGRR